MIFGVVGALSCVSFDAFFNLRYSTGLSIIESFRVIFALCLLWSCFDLIQVACRYSKQSHSQNIITLLIFITLSITNYKMHLVSSASYSAGEITIGLEQLYNEGDQCIGIAFSRD
ncbi:hypothetical protein EDC56_3543 [Sinobacterium caligoides]|uniref:Uncharacterized protein n=1 Tax=Sinobacterium caligoides TaxID=933926 RepID=A0A3N2DDN0_9GAMM|nr:hypothetical protein EDC56_3543 [Sinobacterium caligoides]